MVIVCSLVRGLRPSRAEVVLGGIFAVVSVAVLGGLLSRGRVLAGAESQVGADQMQYLSWIVSAGQNGSILSWWSIPPQMSSNFFHPGFLISGLLNRAGVDALLSYQLWKLIAIPAVVIAFVAYVRRLVPQGRPRTAALALALFGLSPVGAVLGWNALKKGFSGQVEFAAGELFAPSWLWGYMMTAIAVALLIWGLLLAETATKPGASRITKAALPATAFFCSWLQPWQGAELLGAVLLTDVLISGRGLRGLLAVGRGRAGLVVAGVLPLAYYFWLGTSESVWKIAASANNAVPLWSVGVWLAVLLPWFPAIRCYFKRPEGWQPTALRIVPVLMMAEYGLISITRAGTFPFHAVQGMTLFLAALSVEGALLMRDRAWWGRHLPLAVVAVLVMCVPGTLHRLNLMRLEIHRSAQPYFLEAGEVEALAQLKEESGPGGVLAPIKAALSVPAHSQRPVWVGELSWTPDFRERVERAEKLFKGHLTASQALVLVAESNARFLYADCGHTFDLRTQLSPQILKVTQHGCARVYEIRSSAK